MPGELIPIVLFVSIAAVAILRPLTTRIGRLLENQYADRKATDDPQIKRVTELMERLVDRLDRLEDRVDFTERVLERQRTPAALASDRPPGRLAKESPESQAHAGEGEDLASR